AFGHAGGDAVLHRVAEALLANLRSSDIVGRLGGDEFGVILAQADLTAAAEKATSLTRAILEVPACAGDRDIHFDISCGVHAFGPGEDVEAALSAADRAMYAQKNRVIPATGTG
ncbi:MAG: diguanylate cyclase, partial [Alphaproteobacteria bacterium]